MQRFYLTFNASGFPSPADPDYGSQWDIVNANVRRHLLASRKMGTALSSTTATQFAETSAAAVNVLQRQFVSEPLPAQTIAGTFAAVIKGGETTTSGDQSLQVVVRVVSGDGATQRGVLYAGHTAALNATVGALGQEFSTATQGRIIPAGTPLTPVVVQEGDRLVVEVGMRHHNTLTTSQSGYLGLGDSFGNVDLPLVAGTNPTAAPWIEFSQDLLLPELRTFTGRGGDAGAPVLATDGNGAAPDAIETGATGYMTYVDDPVRGRCIEMGIGASGEVTRLMFDGFRPMLKGSAKFYVQMSDTALATARFFGVMASNSGAIFYLARFTSTNRPTFLNSTSATSGFTVATQPPVAANLPPDAWRRVEITWERDPTTFSTYTLGLSIFDGDSADPLGTLSTGYITAPTDVGWRFQLGIIGGTTAPSHMRFSDIKMAQGDFSALGPEIPPSTGPAPFIGWGRPIAA